MKKVKQFNYFLTEDAVYKHKFQCFLTVKNGWTHEVKYIMYSASLNTCISFSFLNILSSYRNRSEWQRQSYICAGDRKY